MNMKLKLVISLLAFCFYLSLAVQSWAIGSGVTATYDTSKHLVSMGYEFPLGFLSWGFDGDGNLQLILAESIDRVDICVKGSNYRVYPCSVSGESFRGDKGYCVEAEHSVTHNGNFFVSGEITAFPGQWIQMKATSWEGDEYELPMGSYGNPVNKLYSLPEGWHPYQDNDGVWGILMGKSIQIQHMGWTGSNK